MPPAIQNIIEANRLFAENFAQSVSFPIAFLAGTLSILSPCILPILPAFFANAFKERKAITKMTFIFFFGFAIIFIGMGIAAGFLGKSLFDLPFRNSLIIIAGICLVILGIFILLGLGLPSMIKRRQASSDTQGIFLSGVFFAFGWSACLGPILAGILTMGSILHDWLKAGLLLFFYSLGIFLPLLLLSLFFDRFGWLKKSFWSKPLFRIQINNRLFPIFISNLIGGLLLVIIGSTFVIAKGTNFINYFDMFGGKQLFYDWQRNLIQ